MADAVPPFIVHVEDEAPGQEHFRNLLKRIAEAKEMSFSDVMAHVVQVDTFEKAEKFFKEHPKEIAAVFTDNQLMGAEYGYEIMDITDKLSPKPIRAWVGSNWPRTDLGFLVPGKIAMVKGARSSELTTPVIRAIIDGADADLLREKCPSLDWGYGLSPEIMALTIKTVSESIDALGLSQAKTAMEMARLGEQTGPRRPDGASPGAGGGDGRTKA